MFFKKHKNEETLRTLELKYVFLVNVYKDEMERKRYLEKKATLIITSLAIIGTIEVCFIGLLFGSGKQIGLMNSIFLCWIFLCLCISMYYSNKVSSIQGFQKPYIEDMNDISSKLQYYVMMIKRFEYYIINNSTVINKKVKYLNNSQYWFNAIIVTMPIFLLFLLINLLVPNNNKPTNIYNELVISVLGIFISLLLPYRSQISRMHEKQNKA